MTTQTNSFTSRTVPWMSVGTVIDDESVDAARAAKLGGLDFDVDVRRCSFERPAADSWRIVDNRQALVRGDTEQFFSFVSTGYQVVQYRDAFTFMDGINPRYVAAGTFGGGRQGFMVVQLPDHLSLNPFGTENADPHQLYIVLRASHDLSKAIEIAVLPLRERCMNQLPLASFARNAPQRWSIRHVGDPMAKLRVAQDTLGKFERYTEGFERRVRQLASIPTSNDEFIRVLKVVLPDRVGRDNQIASIQGAFRSSEHVGFEGTAWGAVNAVSEYFEHGRNNGSQTPQSRFLGGLAGTTAKYVNRTAQLLLAG